MTVASGATLTLESSTNIAASASLLLDGTAVVTNNFSGIGTIGALSFDGGATFQPVGTWGATGSGATYIDDTHFKGTGQLDVVGATSTIVISALNPSVYGQSVIFTSTVTGTGGTPTGTVTFMDGATTLGAVTLDGSGVATFSTNNLSVVGSPHAITAVYAGDSNFTGNTSDPLLQTITAATLTVTPNAMSTSYIGAALNNTNYSTDTANYSITGFQNAETVSSAGVTLSGSMAFNGSASTSVRNVGTYTQAVGTLAMSSANDNYVMSFSNPTPNDYVITQASLTISAVANTRNYDGTTSAAAIPATTGLLGSDTVTGSAEIYDTRNVGTGKTLSVTGDAVNDGNAANNYSRQLRSPDTTGVINARRSPSPPAPNTKTYDATTSAAALPTSPAAPCRAVIRPRTSRRPTTPDAGTGKTLTPAGVVNDGNSGNNYAVTLATSTTGVINKATLTLTAATNTKIYDGTTSAAAIPPTSGLQGSDTATGLAETYDTQHAGTAKTLSVSAYTVNDGNSGNNYSYTFVNDTTGVINARPITVTAATNTKAYDATTSAAALPTVTSGSLQGTDTPSFSETYDTKDVGTGKTLTPAGVVNDGNSGNNYSYTFVNDTTGVITAHASAGQRHGSQPGL